MAVVGLAALPAAAAAQTSAPPSLTGETLSAAPSRSAAPYPFFLPCGNGPTSGPTFKFSGKATGPFAGTFNESGTISYTPTSTPPPEVDVPVTAYSATFKITSKQGSVTGSETLVLPSGAMATCLAGAGGGGVSIGPVETAYTATIKTASGSYQDHGTSSATLSQSFGLGQFWSASLGDAFTAAPAGIGPPTIGGSPIEGQTLSESPGTWSGSPSAFRYQWLRCDTAGNNCSDIGGADTQTYTLTSLDVGGTIRVQEWATNAGGTSGPATSGVTPVIQASASPPPPPPPPSPPTPTPSPPSSLGGSTAPGSGGLATSAQIRALLLRQVIPVGRPATITALVRHDGYTFTFRTLTAGRLVIAWYVVPGGARISRVSARPVLVATGSARFAAAGRVRITVRLTAAGRRLLRRAKSLTVAETSTYTPAGQPAVSAARAVTLRR